MIKPLRTMRPISTWPVPKTIALGGVATGIINAHEAEIVAAIAEVLIQDGMLDGDDEDYAAFCKQLLNAAAEVAAAVRLSDSEQARQAVGRVTKSCSDCHEIYR